jgi:hypothetical protein
LAANSKWRNEKMIDAMKIIEAVTGILRGDPRFPRLPPHVQLALFKCALDDMVEEICMKEKGQADD